MQLSTTTIASRIDQLIRTDQSSHLSLEEAMRRISSQNGAGGTPAEFNPLLLNQIFDAVFGAASSGRVADSA